MRNVDLWNKSCPFLQTAVAFVLITHCHLCYDLFDQRHSCSQRHYSRVTSSMPNWTLFLSKRTNFHICRGSTWPYRMTSASVTVVNEPAAQSKPGIPEWHVKGPFVWCLNTWNLPSRLICVLFGGFFLPPSSPSIDALFSFFHLRSHAEQRALPFLSRTFPLRLVCQSIARVWIQLSCHSSGSLAHDVLLGLLLAAFVPEWLTQTASNWTDAALTVWLKQIPPPVHAAAKAAVKLSTPSS